MKIAIVYPVLNQFEMAIKAMESIQTKHDWTPIIIPQYERQRPLTQAWNEGIQAGIDSGADYILVSNDDVLYSPWTIDGLVKEFEHQPDDVILVTCINLRGNMAVPNLVKYIPEPVDTTFSEGPDFACFMVRDDFFDQVGYFDENIFPAYYEDNEMHCRIKALGLKAIATTRAPYYHYGSQTQNKALSENKPVVDGHAFNLNGQYVREKWNTTDAASPDRFSYPFNDPTNDPKVWKREWRTY